MLRNTTIQTTRLFRGALFFLLFGLQIYCISDVWAANAGDAELKAFSSILTGNIGLALGLCLAIWGIIKAVVSGETAMGFTLIICGILLTIFPGVFNAATSTFLPVVQSITGR